jgi:hypothetical protein
MHWFLYCYFIHVPPPHFLQSQNIACVFVVGAFLTMTLNDILIRVEGDCKCIVPALLHAKFIELVKQKLDDLSFLSCMKQSL